MLRRDGFTYLPWLPVPLATRGLSTKPLRPSTARKFNRVTWSVSGYKVAMPCVALISSEATFTSRNGSPLTERVKLRLEAQFFNVFNHPNFGLPSMVPAGIPGKRSTKTGFGALTCTTSPPTGLLGVGLGGDNSPRVIAFQLRLEF